MPVLLSCLCGCECCRSSLWLLPWLVVSGLFRCLGLFMDWGPRMGKSQVDSASLASAGQFSVCSASSLAY